MVDNEGVANAQVEVLITISVECCERFLVGRHVPQEGILIKYASVDTSCLASKLC